MTTDEDDEDDGDSDGADAPDGDEGIMDVICAASCAGVTATLGVEVGVGAAVADLIRGLITCFSSIVTTTAGVER